MRYLLGSLIFTTMLLAGCEQKVEQSVIAVNLGIPNQPSSALLHIALDQGYFTEAGLNVTPHYYASGKRALLDGYVSGEIDYLSTADAPFVLKVSTELPELKVLASIYTTDNLNRIVARKDAGISSLVDLKGKRVATQSNSAVHYFLHSVIEEQQLEHSELSVSFMPADQLPLSLAGGQIDAFSMREPYVSQARDLLGDDKVVVLASPGTYVQSELLIARDTIHAKQPEVAERILSALIKAERFALDDADAAIAVVSKALKTTPDAIAVNWQGFDYAVRLNQALLSQLERMSQWIVLEVDNKAVPPNFLNSIDSAPLTKVAPSAVSLVR